ncbi:MAG: hypothetical protein ACRDOY_11000 [Nocardioidaceae bacterium]
MKFVLWCLGGIVASMAALLAVLYLVYGPNTVASVPGEKSQKHAVVMGTAPPRATPSEQLSSSATGQAPPRSERPIHRTTRVREGRTFAHEEWSASQGWRVESRTVKGLFLTNTSRRPDTPKLTLRFRQGLQTVEVVNCIGTEVRPQQEARMRCVGDGRIPDYKKIKVDDTF